MAKIVEEIIEVKFSRVVRTDAKGAFKSVISSEHIATLDVTLQEVLDLPAGVVVEVERGTD